MKKRLQEIKDLYKSIYYVEEDMIIDVILAIAIATKTISDPIWLMIVGGSSSGKTELVNLLNKIDFSHGISNLTENTFLSSMKLSNGQEASLLHRIGSNGMITMKDYTSILQMSEQKRDVIISQMREIYDGKLEKLAGNGQSQKWTGKINFIGACTEMIYDYEEKTAGMGHRTINYMMPAQDRIKTTKRARKNNSDIQEKRERLQDAVAEYVRDFLATMPPELPEIEDTFSEELIKLADFSTLARSPTVRDYKGEIKYAPAPEMPMRMFQSLYTLCRVLRLMYDGYITPNIKKVVTRLCFDSIPKQQRLALYQLASHKNVTAKGAAEALNLPTNTVRKALEDLNAHKVCKRQRSGGVGPDLWSLRKDFQELMHEYLGIEQKDDTLLDEDSYMDEDNVIQDVWLENEIQKFKDDKPVKKTLGEWEKEGQIDDLPEEELDF